MGEGTKPKSLLRTAAALAVLFLLDLGYAGQGILSLFVAFIGLVLLTLGALWAVVRGAAPLPDRLDQLVPEFLPAVPRATSARLTMRHQFSETPAAT